MWHYNYIDIPPPPPPPPMAGCTVTLENSSVVVMCTFTNPSVMGYLVLFRFRDEDILNVNRSQDIMTPVVFEASSIGPHHVIVFPIMGENGIIGASVLYSELIEVTPPTSAPTTSPPHTSASPPPTSAPTSSNLTLNTTTSAGNAETAIIMIVVGM